jgi:uncharacterized protein YecT (DUF1311 family)
MRLLIRTLSCFTIVFVGLVFVTGSPAQSTRNNERPAACDQYDQLPVPPADLPSAAEREGLARCDSYKLYFGLNDPANAVAARKCAYLQRDDKTRIMDNPFESSGLLAMIYANGRGAARNFKMAQKFSCEIDGAPAENSGRFEHLAKLQQQNWMGSDFNLCDDSTSGFMQGWCAKLNNDLAKVEQGKNLKSLTARWSAVEKQAFQLLQQAANAYFQTSSQNEVDLSGTGRAAFEIEAEATLQDEFQAALQRFEKGDLPSFAAEQFHEADGQLNSGYAKIQFKPAQGMAYTTVTPDGIKLTQRAWLRYRDAWVKFGAIKYPTVSADSWKTWLTQQRIKQLQPWL